MALFHVYIYKFDLLLHMLSGAHKNRGLQSTMQVLIHFCVTGSPPYKNVRFSYSIHSTVKPQKSTFNSYNLFFYRFVVIFNMKYHFLKIFHKKHHFLRDYRCAYEYQTRSGILLHRGWVPGQWPLPRGQSKMADTDRSNAVFGKCQ